MMPRRQFIGRSIQAALIAGSSNVLDPQASRAQRSPSEPPIIDTHQHLWDLTKLRISWLKSGDPLNHSCLVPDYLKAAAGLGISKAIYMEVHADVDCLATEADYAVDICRRADAPTVAAVIGGRPGDESFGRYIARFKDSPYVKGVRQIVRADQQGQNPCRDKRFVNGIQLLGELGMRFDLCLPPTELSSAVELVDQCPDTQFILDHCGNSDPTWFGTAGKDETVARTARQWRRDVAALAKRDHVVCKISGIISRAPKDHWTPDLLAPAVNHCLDTFGPDRVMFASDWPICTRVATLRQWIEAIRQIVAHRNLEERRKLFHDNAVRVYELETLKKIPMSVASALPERSLYGETRGA